MAHFLITECKAVDRHTEPPYESLKMGDIVPAKSEEITMTIRLVSSGNTSKIPIIELIEAIMEQLETVPKQ